MNYVHDLASAIGWELPDCPLELCETYALLGLVKGADITLEDVHDAWSVWRTRTSPGHKSLVPFSELSPEVQALDAPYRDGIIAAVRAVRGA